MKKHYLNLALRTLLLGGAFLMQQQVSAQWTLVKDQEATYAADVTPSGNLLISDYQFDGSGGIYLSTDKGSTWNKTEAFDFCYSKFLHFDKYIFAAGQGTCIARSEDEGKTWKNMFYSEAVNDVLGSNAQQTVAYAMAVHKGKLFVGDFCGGGIFYTEDFGETWKKTDLASLQYELDDKKKETSHIVGLADVRPHAEESTGDDEEGDGKKNLMTENIYQLVSYNGHLYAFGIYFVFELDEATMKWNIIRNDSNFMAVSTQFKNKLILGRSVMNETFNSPFLVTLDENGEWGELNRPEGKRDNNVRALACDDHNIYAGMQMTGMYFTPNEGESWYELFEGLPTMQSNPDMDPIFLSPMTIIPTEDCIYLALYNNPGGNGSGLYKINRSDLDNKLSGIEAHPAEGNAPSLTIDGHKVNVKAEGAAVLTLWDTAGRCVARQAVNGQASINVTQAGIYTFHLGTGQNAKTGKFVIK